MDDDLNGLELMLAPLYEYIVQMSLLLDVFDVQETANRNNVGESVGIPQGQLLAVKDYKSLVVKHA